MRQRNKQAPQSAEETVKRPSSGLFGTAERLSFVSVRAFWLNVI